MPQVGILFLDLDNFKRVNDHYGHVIGDRLIKDVSAASRTASAKATSSRGSGGDEFIVLCQGATMAELEICAQRILERLRIPFNLGLIEVLHGLLDRHRAEPRARRYARGLIRSADTAMYVRERPGKRNLPRVLARDDKKVAEYMWLDTNLPRAFEDRQLILHYQPKLCLERARLLSVEALVRWNSPERGIISPLDFIPYAEESGMIGPLGRWVMQTAAAQARRWHEQGLDMRVAINVSARSSPIPRSSMIWPMRSRRRGLKPCMLDLELTEAA